MSNYLMTFKEWLNEQEDHQVYVSDSGIDTTERKVEKNANRERDIRIRRMKRDEKLRRKIYDVKQLAWDIKTIARAKDMLASELDIFDGKTAKV